MMSIITMKDPASSSSTSSLINDAYINDDLMKRCEHVRIRNGLSPPAVTAALSYVLSVHELSLSSSTIRVDNHDNTAAVVAPSSFRENNNGNGITISSEVSLLLANEWAKSSSLYPSRVRLVAHSVTTCTHTLYL
jgi:hypothetical protein